MKKNLNFLNRSSMKILLVFILSSSFLISSGQETAIPSYNADSSVLTYFQFQKLRKIKIVDFEKFKSSVTHTKWYKNSTPIYENAELVPDFSLDTLIPSSLEEGSNSYFVVIYFNNCNCQATSNIKTIRVLANSQKPILSQNFSKDNINYCENSPVSPLKITLTNAENYHPKIQWYVNNSGNEYNGVPLDNENGLEFTPTSKINNMYYYATISFSEISTKLTSNISGPVVFQSSPVINIKNQDNSTEKTFVLNKSNLLNLKASGAISYEWFKDNKKINYSENDKAQFYINENTNILVKGIDENGCSASNSYTVLYNGNNSSKSFVVKNIITPNSDYVNDYLEINNETNEPIKLKIYNSLGNLIYKSDNYKNNWNGIDEAKGQIAQGNYFYSLEIGSQKEAGNITLVR